MYDTHRPRQTTGPPPTPPQREQPQSCGFRKTLFMLDSTFWFRSSSELLWRFFANFFFMLPIKLSYLQINEVSHR